MSNEISSEPVSDTLEPELADTNYVVPNLTQNKIRLRLQKEASRSEDNAQAVPTVAHATQDIADIISTQYAIRAIGVTKTAISTEKVIPVVSRREPRTDYSSKQSVQHIKTQYYSDNPYIHREHYAPAPHPLNIAVTPYQLMMAPMPHNQPNPIQYSLAPTQCHAPPQPQVPLLQPQVLLPQPQVLLPQPPPPMLYSVPIYSEPVAQPYSQYQPAPVYPQVSHPYTPTTATAIFSAPQTPIYPTMPTTVQPIINPPAYEMYAAYDASKKSDGSYALCPPGLEPERPVTEIATLETRYEPEKMATETRVERKADRDSGKHDKRDNAEYAKRENTKHDKKESLESKLDHYRRIVHEYKKPNTKISKERYERAVIWIRGYKPEHSSKRRHSPREVSHRDTDDGVKNHGYSGEKPKRTVKLVDGVPLMSVSNNDDIDREVRMLSAARRRLEEERVRHAAALRVRPLPDHLSWSRSPPKDTHHNFEISKKPNYVDQHDRRERTQYDTHSLKKSRRNERSPDLKNRSRSPSTQSQRRYSASSCTPERRSDSQCKGRKNRSRSRSVSSKMRSTGHPARRSRSQNRGESSVRVEKGSTDEWVSKEARSSRRHEYERSAHKSRCNSRSPVQRQRSPSPNKSPNRTRYITPSSQKLSSKYTFSLDEESKDFYSASKSQIAASGFQYSSKQDSPVANVEKSSIYDYSENRHGMKDIKEFPVDFGVELIIKKQLNLDGGLSRPSVGIGALCRNSSPPSENRNLSQTAKKREDEMHEPSIVLPNKNSVLEMPQVKHELYRKANVIDYNHKANSLIDERKPQEVNNTKIDHSPGPAVAEATMCLLIPNGILYRDSMRYFNNPFRELEPGARTYLDLDRWKSVITGTVEKILQARQQITIDIGLYAGAAGIAFMLYRVAHSQHFQNVRQELLIHADELLLFANAPSTRRFQREFMLDGLGVLAVHNVVAKARGQHDDANNFANKYTSSTKFVLQTRYLGGSADELFVGKAGFVCGALFMNKANGSEVISEDIIVNMCRKAYESGRKKKSLLPNSVPLSYEHYGTSYIGAAHGLSSIVQMMLSVPGFYRGDDATIEPMLKRTVDTICSLQRPNGNVPSSLEEVNSKTKQGDDLVHWCHGAPGVVYLFAKAYLIWKDPKYLEACVQCAELVWEKGLLTKGLGICHGVAGNAYVFLLLYRLINDSYLKSKYLHRAVKFAEFMTSKEFTQQSRRPDHPYSLFEGLAGAVCFLTDMLSPDTAAFPFFDIF